MLLLKADVFKVHFQIVINVAWVPVDIHKWTVVHAFPRKKSVADPVIARAYAC